jgi:hypothetical protein
MSLDKLQQFSERIKAEREELRFDLLGMAINSAECNVGDFGCGWGFITWCLLLEIPNSVCIGIDKFDPSNPPEPEDIFRDEQFSIESVQNRFEKVSDEIRSGALGLQVQEPKYPTFQRGDILTGENLLPKFNHYFDLIYCKRVLYNIFVGDNSNPDREDGVNLAITHVANALKPGGWFCFVEVEELHNSLDLEGSLICSGFKFNLPRRVCRPYKTILQVYDKCSYLIYHCKKAV